MDLCGTSFIALFGGKILYHIGVSRHAIMSYENGVSERTLDNLKKIASVLGIEADMLFDDYYKFLNYPYTVKIKEIRKEKSLGSIS